MGESESGEAASSGMRHHPENRGLSDASNCIKSVSSFRGELGWPNVRDDRPTECEVDSPASLASGTVDRVVMSQ